MKFSLLLFVIVTLHLLSVPIVELKSNAYAYETFYKAVNYFKEGLSPYAQYPGFDLYKYSPTFLAFPLLPMSGLPLIPSAILWQLISTLSYFLAGYWLFKLWFTDNAGFKQVMTSLSNLPSWLVILGTFLFLTDFHLNGTYLQSNTIVVAGMMIGVALYIRKQWLWAALVLAFVTNMKLYPIVLVLLLFLDLRMRFIWATLFWHLLLIAIPFLLWGSETAIKLYSDWIGTLVIDKALVYQEPYIHFFLNLRAFLQVNFNLVFAESYFLIMLFFAALVGIAVLVQRWITQKHHFTQPQLMMILAASLMYILVFSPRTEGPTLVFLGPVYLITLWQLWHFNENSKSEMIWALISLFVLTSMSTSDLFRGTFIHDWSWDFNLRVIGLLILFLVYLYWLFKPPVSIQTPRTTDVHI
ncbi:glycosyltransferase family 87 protein [Thiosulfativibrio zosterae]|nr:glycosyltransferase family 87 protein [Thiosulfativibrio zosterae]